MYLTTAEFRKFCRSADALISGEPHAEQLDEAIRLGSATLDELLSERYYTPFDLSQLPEGTQARLKRWCKYLALESLMGMIGLSINREARVILLDIIDGVREEIKEHLQSAAELEGAPTRVRILGGETSVAP